MNCLCRLEKLLLVLLGLTGLAHSANGQETNSSQIMLENALGAILKDEAEKLGRSLELKTSEEVDLLISATRLDPSPGYEFKSVHTSITLTYGQQRVGHLRVISRSRKRDFWSVTVNKILSDARLRDSDPVVAIVQSVVVERLSKDSTVVHRRVVNSYLRYSTDASRWEAIPIDSNDETAERGYEENQ